MFSIPHLSFRVKRFRPPGAFFVAPRIRAGKLSIYGTRSWFSIPIESEDADKVVSRHSRLTLMFYRIGKPVIECR